MKNLLVLMYIICFSGCKSQVQESVEAVGSWEICISQRNGIKEHPNHCPEITFFSDGNGVLEASDPSSKFQWKIVEDKIYFTFKSSYDEEQFLSKVKELKYKFYHDDNLQYFKLINETNGDWYLLSKEK